MSQPLGQIPEDAELPDDVDNGNLTDTTIGASEPTETVNVPSVDSTPNSQAEGGDDILNLPPQSIPTPRGNIYI